jgi:HlyD family secretion protein
MIYIKAPIDGTVSQIYVKETQNVKPGESLVSISNKAGFEARFYVTSDEIDLIKVGSPAKIEDRGASIEGRVVEVPLVMDPSKGAFAVRALFSGNTHSFVSGMSVDVAVQVYQNKNALVVPRNVIGRSEKGAYVYVANGNHAQKRDVVLGRERGLDVEVVYGLKPGDQLIVDGIQGISNNVLLKISR